jgi:hypothetical protein
MTDANVTAEFLKSAICGMTSAVRINQGWEVTLPQAYHTGHAAVVLVSDVPGGFLVHDNSYAAMIVSQFGHSISQTIKDYLERAVQHYGCELEQFKIVRKCTNRDELALSMVLVGCASRLVADQALSAERQPIFDFRSQMVTRVTEVVGSKRIRVNEEVHGHLGAKYNVSAVVLDPAERRPIAFVEPVSGKDAVARRFKEFYDISKNQSYAGIERVAVYDDRKGITGSDILLMQEVSNPVRFIDTGKRFAEWAIQ